MTAKPAAAPKMCFDRIVSRDVMRPHLTTTGPSGMTRALAPRDKTWLNGSTLRVRFMGGTAAEQATAREQALWWANYANLTFDFGNAPDAEIRITFDTNDGAWSTIGTDSGQVPNNQATMNLGFLDGGTAGHEFGHAIGLAHEHSSPAGGIQWNEPVVLAALAGPPNYWNEETTRHNVFYKYSLDQINGTAFDPASCSTRSRQSGPRTGSRPTPTTFCPPSTRSSSPARRCTRSPEPAQQRPPNWPSAAIG